MIVVDSSTATLGITQWKKIYSRVRSRTYANSIPATGVIRDDLDTHKSGGVTVQECPGCIVE
jgi:hypothetical protein